VNDGAGNSGHASILNRSVLYSRKEMDVAKLQEWVRGNAPKPEVLRKIGEQSVSNGTATLSSAQIDSIIRATRRDRKLHSLSRTEQ
jgi:type III secretory pathway component EscV